MLQFVTPHQVNQIIRMCEDHVATLPVDSEAGPGDLWHRDGGPLSPAAKAVNRFHAELSAHIAGLTPDAQIEVMALMMIGRYPNDFRSFAEAVKDAREEHDSHTPDYLADKQLVIGQYLKNGLEVIRAKAA